MQGIAPTLMRVKTWAEISLPGQNSFEPFFCFTTRYDICFSGESDILQSIVDDPHQSRSSCRILWPIIYLGATASHKRTIKITESTYWTRTITILKLCFQKHNASFYGTKLWPTSTTMDDATSPKQRAVKNSHHQGGASRFRNATHLSILLHLCSLNPILN